MDREFDRNQSEEFLEEITTRVQNFNLSSNELLSEFIIAGGGKVNTNKAFGHTAKAKLTYNLNRWKLSLDSMYFYYSTGKESQLIKIHESVEEVFPNPSILTTKLSNPGRVK